MCVCVCVCVCVVLKMNQQRDILFFFSFFRVVGEGRRRVE